MLPNESQLLDMGMIIVSFDLECGHTIDFALPNKEVKEAKMELILCLCIGQYIGHMQSHNELSDGMG
jgi:hypothetical protein